MRHNFKLNIHVKHQNALQRYTIKIGTPNFLAPTNIKSNLTISDKSQAFILDLNICYYIKFVFKSYFYIP